MASYQYHVATYTSDSPTFEGICWHPHWQTERVKDYQRAKQIFDKESDDMAKCPGTICRISQGRRTEEQAFNQPQSSMHAETWECHRKDGTRFWYYLVLYVTKAKEN